MGFPTNDGGLSIAGILKWIAIISGVVALIHAFQGIVQKQGATGSNNHVGDYLQGSDAVKWGFLQLGYAVLFFAAAWALWFFWQRNED